MFMKGKFKSALLLVFALILSLTACSGGGEPNEGGENKEPKEVIFSPEVSASIVKSALDEELDTGIIFDKIYELTGKFAPKVTDDNAPVQHEIVFGDTNRSISAVALEKLEKVILDKEREAEDNGVISADLDGYVVYSDGKSCAVVWSDPIIADFALSDFVAQFLVSDTLVLKNGYVYSHVDELISYKKVYEAEERREMFAEIETQLGAEATEALKKYYSLFDERYYTWMANLYDPGEYDADGNPIGGGYYFSNSGRDNVGYGIDLESTAQALTLLSSSGMLREYEVNGTVDWMAAIPEKMQREIVAFVKSLQSPEDGYFYHPQWESVTVSRRGRDLDWATSLLERFGAVPYWDTPNGYEGEFGAPGAVPASNLSDSLSDRKTVAVSAVIAANTSSLPRELQSLANFKTYLDSFTPSMGTQSYSIGNTLGAISSQIVARGEEYVKAFEEWANSLQNPENGLWEDKVHYNSVNGLMKLSGTYNTLGIKFNYADAALESALKMIMHEGEDVKGKEAVNSVDVWNPFCAITNLMENIGKFGGEDRLNEFLSKVRADATELIYITLTKTAQFKKPDGSFGYGNGPVGATSQGAPVAVGGTVEGDINGGNIAVTGVSNYMCRVLGIDVVPLYYPTDLEIYFNCINELGPVVKDDVVIETTPIDFEEDLLGTSTPNKIAVQVGSGSVNVVEDPRGEDLGNVLKFVTKKGVYTAISTSPAATRSGGCYYLSFDICLPEINEKGTFFQIKVGKSYMLTMNLTDGKIVLGDSSNTNGQIAVAQKFGTYFNIGEWANVRVEYYAADEEEDIRVKIYINDNLIAISDNYYGHPTSGVGEPVRDFGTVEFYALQNSDMTVYFDNILAKRVDKTFDLSDGNAAVKWFVTNSEYENVFGSVGAGKYAESEKTLDYTDSRFDGIIGEAASSSVSSEGENKILTVSKLSAESAVASFLKAGMQGPVYVMESDVKWRGAKSTTGETAFKISLISDKDTDGFIHVLGTETELGAELRLEGGETFATLTDNRWYNLRIEAIPSFESDDSFTVKVFLDSKCVVSETAKAPDGVSLAEYYGFIIELCEGASGYSIDLDNTYRGVAVTTAHPDVKYGYSNPFGFDSSIDGGFITEKSTSASSVDKIFSLSDDPTGAANRVLKAFYPKDSASEYAGYTVIKNSSGNTGADAVYSSLSAKVYFETNGDTAGGRVSRLIFKDSSYAFGLDMFVAYNAGSGEYSLRITHYNVGTGGKGAMDTIVDGVKVINKWFDLRIDYCKSGTSSVVSIYIDGVCYAEDVVSYYYGDRIINPGAVGELEWRYIRSGITTYLDDLVYECQVGDATLVEGTDEPTDTPVDPDAPDDSEDPDIGGTENPDKDGTDKESSMPDEGWVEKEEP